MALVYAYRYRAIVRDVTILDADGGTIYPSGSDKVRAVIGRESHLGASFADAQLSVTSDAATDNGSTFTKNHSNGVHRLKILSADLGFPAGTYTLFIDYYDANDAEWKNVSRQVFVLEESET